MRPVAFAFMVFALGMVPATGQQQGLSGRWEGSVTQQGPGTSRGTYSTRMTLGAGTGTIEYPTLNCGGTLTFVEMRGSAYAYRERITDGKERCIDSGLVIVMPSSAGLQWEWMLDITGRATLSPIR